MTENRKYSNSQITGFVSGIVLFALILFFGAGSVNPTAYNMAATAVLMAVWWISEAIPLGATSLIPVVVFPLLGISSGTDAASEYFNSTIFLFLGGFLIAIAMERWNLHKRIALIIILFLGSGSSGIILGFMLATAFLSMFISNTATALMMLPIGISVIHKMQESYKGKDADNFPVSLMLGIAYGASLGGIATLVGTPPNLAFVRIFHISFPESPEISFGNWMLLGLPIAIVMLFLTWILLTKILYKLKNKTSFDKQLLREEYKLLGKPGFEEKCVLAVFVLTAVLWVFRADLSFGSFVLPGWSNLIGNSKYIDDSTVAILMSLLLFILPAKTGERKRLLNAKSFGKIPWEIVILFGGGFALASGFQSSGLSELLGNQLTALSGIPPILMIVIVCFCLTFLTELTSNTATTQTLLPIIAAISVAMRINPLFLMIPATLSASFAFMMPVATPPNAIVFSSGKVTIKQMATTGLILNLVGIVVVTLMFYFLGDFLFGINPNEFPLWAVPKEQ
ncbi:MAG: SLC13 family permease [bacterium]